MLMSLTMTLGETTYEFVPAREPVKIVVHFGNKVHIDDVCRMLGVSRQAVYLMFERGTLTRWTMANKVYVPLADLERLLHEGDKASKRGSQRRKYGVA
jgi:hypothetical protein